MFHAPSAWLRPPYNSAQAEIKSRRSGEPPRIETKNYNFLQPAKAGSVVSFFVDGLGGTVTASPDFIPAYPGGIPMVVQMGNLSAEIVNIAVVNGLVTTHVSMSLVFETGVVPVGPRAGGSLGNPIGAPLATMFWVSP